MEGTLVRNHSVHSPSKNQDSGSIFWRIMDPFGKLMKAIDLNPGEKSQIDIQITFYL